eukprot:5670433-Lingulodinium_polyedra.AAC.1
MGVSSNKLQSLQSYIQVLAARVVSCNSGGMSGYSTFSFTRLRLPEAGRMPQLQTPAEHGVLHGVARNRG